MAVNSTAIAILLISFLVMIMLRFQIAYAVALSSIFCLLYQGLPLTTVCQQMVKGISSFSLMAVPFFITMGCLMGTGGISEKLIALANACVGWMTGGMAMVNIVASYFFGGISGSASADTASLGSILIPMMVEQGYDADFSTAVTITSSCEGLLVPPSHNMVIYAMSAGGVSVGALFLAGYIPGALLAISLMIGSYIISKKRNYPKGDKFSFKVFIRQLGTSFWALAAVIITAAIAALSVFLIVRRKNPRAPEYVFLYAENQTADYPTTLGGEYFADLVFERTGGRIKILVKYNSELGSEADTISQVKYGGIAFARVSLSQLSEKIPDMNLLLMPYLYDNSEHMWRVLEGEIGDEFLKKTADYDLVGLSWYDAGARNFYSSEKPITCLEDLKGMRIRVQESSLMADMVSALGAVPVEVVYSKVYSTLEQGLVDGAENNWPSYETMKHNRVARYYTIDEHIRIPEMQICSKVVFDSLSEEDRQIITECARESAGYERKLWKEREESSRERAVRSGTIVYELSPEEKARFRVACSEIYKKYSDGKPDMIEKIMNY